MPVLKASSDHTLSIEGLAITLTYLRRMADPAAAHMAGRALV